MKCLLINSPIYRDSSKAKEEYLPPLGLGYIATQLMESGVDVEIIDCVKERLGIDEIYKILSQQQPDFIGINVFTQNYEIVKELVENCSVKSTIIIGGQVVKCIYEQIMLWNVENELIITIGEGELILPALINNTCCEKPISCTDKKLIYKVDKHSCYFPKNLDNVYIDRMLLKEDIIVNHYQQKEAAIITSRGCMYNCAFCGGAHNLNRDVTIRFRSVSNIEDEINNILKNNPEISSIRILDDLFLRDNESIDNAISLFEKFENLSWRGMAHVLTFINSLKLLPLLKKSGCRELFLGIESGSARIRKKIHKPGTVEEIEKVISSILDNGIDVKGYFMYGFPGETVSDANQTYLLASKLKEISEHTYGRFRTSVFQFRPYHGTQLYNEIIQSGREIDIISSNAVLNVLDRRSQFNFHSGNYSKIDDCELNEFILKTHMLSEVYNA